MVDGAALFVKNFYIPFFRPDASEKHVLAVGRIAALVIVSLGLLLSGISESVVTLLVIGWSLPAFWGIALWGGVIWRRCNSYGAWAGVVGSASLWYLSRFVWGWELAQQFTLYIVGGFVMLIVVSLLTPRMKKEQLDTFYTVLHTPVGEEHKLREAGIEVVME